MGLFYKPSSVAQFTILELLKLHQYTNSQWRNIGSSEGHILSQFNEAIKISKGIKCPKLLIWYTVSGTFNLFYVNWLINFQHFSLRIKNSNYFTSYLTLIDLFITPLFGTDAPPSSAGKTQEKVCVGRDRGSRRKRQEHPAPSEPTSSGCTFLAGMNPFILKSNPCCRVGETVVLICASAISSSLGEQSICYWNR